MKITKNRMRKVPDGPYMRVNKMGNLLKIPTTKAFLIQEKILMGDFIPKKVRRKKNKYIYELEFEI